MALSKTKIDQLGLRLRQADTISQDDVRMLDEYRLSFGSAYESVVQIIREKLGLNPTGRAAKTIPSIVQKLRRQNTRLSQIQDIAGCRLVVGDIIEQDRVVARLENQFDKVQRDDRRAQPSHGYRAVHVIVATGGKLVEIQVRTQLQHVWAELSEKYSDVIDPELKYGRGNPEFQGILVKTSGLVESMEELPRHVEKLKLSGTQPEKLRLFEEREEEARMQLVEALRSSISLANKIQELKTLQDLKRRLES
jgi:ppGpp synthetase/RelA/SpoT-type nucleotidyltranferase